MLNILLSTNSKKSIFLKFLFFILTFFILCFPSNHNIYFDGLIFDKIFEVLFILFVLPILIIFKIKLKLIHLVIIVILMFIKVILIFNVNSGIISKQFLVLDSQINNTSEVKIINFDGLWNKNNDSVINQDLTNTNQFPFEWINYYNPNNGVLGFSIDEFPPCYSADVQCNHFFPTVENFKIKINLHSHIYLKQDSKIYFVLDGAIFSEINLLDHSNNILKSPIIQKNDNFKINNLPTIKKGVYEMQGEIVFQSKNIFFQPKIYTDNKIYSAFDKNIFYQTKSSNTIYFELINFLCSLFNFVVFFLLIIFSFDLIKKINNNLPFKKYKYFYFNLFLFVILIFSYNLFFKNLQINNLILSNKSLYQIFSGTFLIALYFSLIILIIFWQRKSLNFFNFKSIKYFYFFFIIIFSLFFVFYFWNQEIMKFTIHSQGDDWWIFEYFAYRILILKEYLRAGEDIFYFRPLIRYVFALIHYVFGDTFFVHRIIDIWIILLTGLLTLYILILNKVNLGASLCFALLLLIFYFGETFKLLIGRGLSEYYASIILVYILYKFLSYKNNLNFFKVLFLSFVGIIGIWFREDHLFVTLALIVFVNTSYKSQENILGLIYDSFTKHRSLIVIYCSVVVLGFFLLFLRNFIVSGQFFAFNIHFNLNSLNNKSWQSIYTIIAGSILPNLPRTFSIVNFLALFLSIFLIFSKKIKLEVLSFALIIISIVFPYLFLNNWGYYPRYSIHLVPFALIFLVIFFNKQINLILKK